MGRHRWILLQRATQWIVMLSDGEHATISETDIDSEDLNDADLAEAIAAQLTADGYDGSGVLVALDSEECLAVTANVDPSVRSSGRHAVMYELEQYLPLAAEAFTADYHEHSKGLFAVVVETGLFLPLLQALEDRGVFVQSLIPAALVVAQGLIRHVVSNNGLTNEVDHALLWGNQSHVDCVFIDKEGVYAWYHPEATTSSILQLLKAHKASTNRAVLVHSCCLPKSVVELSVGEPGIDSKPLEIPQELGANANTRDFPTESLASSAYEILSGKMTTWIDIRRDALGISDRFRPIRRSIWFASLGAMMVCVSLSAAFYLHSQQYARLKDDQEIQQAAIFQEVLPDQHLRTGFCSRLESEYKKMSGLKGKAAELPNRMSSLKTLHYFLQSLPNRLRFRIQEVRFEQDQISLDGQVRTHSDADKIASSLREGGFHVEAPSTRAIPNQGIDVHLTARWHGAP